MVYSAHEAFKHRNSQTNVNPKHARWVDFISEYYFVLKHKFGVENNLADALNSIGCRLHIMRVEVVGFNRLKDAYCSCPDFGPVYLELLAGNRRPYVDFVLHDGYLFRGSQLCIPQTSFRGFSVWEMHAKGLAGHLGKDRTIALVACGSSLSLAFLYERCLPHSV